MQSISFYFLYQMFDIDWKLQKFLDWTHKRRIPATELPAVKNQNGYCSTKEVEAEK